MRLIESLKNKKFILFNIFFTLYIGINLIGGERGLISYFDKKKVYAELENKEKIIKMFDKRFFRMWEFYLLASKYSFINMENVVFQIQIAKNIASFTNVPLGDGPGLVPIFDGRLPDGSRVNGTIPPISPDGPTLTIRKFMEDPLTMLDLIKFGTVTSRLAAMMWVWIEGLDSRPANFVIAGGTGSGKTMRYKLIQNHKEKSI